MDNHLKAYLAGQFRTSRREAGLTQEELATKIIGYGKSGSFEYALTFIQNAGIAPGETLIEQFKSAQEFAMKTIGCGKAESAEYAEEFIRNSGIVR